MRYSVCRGTVASLAVERDGLSTSATPIQVQLVAVIAAGDRPTRPTLCATGGVDWRSSDSLFGVDKTTVVSIIRHPVQFVRLDSGCMCLRGFGT